MSQMLRQDDIFINPNNNNQLKQGAEWSTDQVLGERINPEITTIPIIKSEDFLMNREGQEHHEHKHSGQHVDFPGENLGLSAEKLEEGLIEDVPKQSFQTREYESQILPSDLRSNDYDKGTMYESHQNHIEPHHHHHHHHHHDQFDEGHIQYHTPADSNLLIIQDEKEYQSPLPYKQNIQDSGSMERERYDLEQKQFSSRGSQEDRIRQESPQQYEREQRIEDFVRPSAEGEFIGERASLGDKIKIGISLAYGVSKEVLYETGVFMQSAAEKTRESMPVIKEKLYTTREKLHVAKVQVGNAIGTAAEKIAISCKTGAAQTNNELNIIENEFEVLPPNLRRAELQQDFGESLPDLSLRDSATTQTRFIGGALQQQDKEPVEIIREEIIIVQEFGKDTLYDQSQLIDKPKSILVENVDNRIEGLHVNQPAQMPLQRPFGHQQVFSQMPQQQVLGGMNNQPFYYQAMQGQPGMMMPNQHMMYQPMMNQPLSSQQQFSQQILTTPPPGLNIINKQQSPLKESIEIKFSPNKEANREILESSLPYKESLQKDLRTSNQLKQQIKGDDTTIIDTLLVLETPLSHENQIPDSPLRKKETEGLRKSDEDFLREEMKFEEKEKKVPLNIASEIQPMQIIPEQQIVIEQNEILPTYLAPHEQFQQEHTLHHSPETTNLLALSDQQEYREFQPSPQKLQNIEGMNQEILDLEKQDVKERFGLEEQRRQEWPLRASKQQDFLRPSVQEEFVSERPSLVDKMKSGMGIAYGVSREVLHETGVFMHTAAERTRESMPVIKEKLHVAKQTFGNAIGNAAEKIAISCKGRATQQNIEMNLVQNEFEIVPSNQRRPELEQDFGERLPDLSLLDSAQAQTRLVGRGEQGLDKEPVEITREEIIIVQEFGKNMFYNQSQNIDKPQDVLVQNVENKKEGFRVYQPTQIPLQRPVGHQKVFSHMPQQQVIGGITNQPLMTQQPNLGYQQAMQSQPGMMMPNQQMIYQPMMNQPLSSQQQFPQPILTTPPPGLNIIHKKQSPLKERVEIIREDSDQKQKELSQHSSLSSKEVLQKDIRTSDQLKKQFKGDNTSVADNALGELQMPLQEKQEVYLSPSKTQYKTGEHQSHQEFLKEERKFENKENYKTSDFGSEYKTTTIIPDQQPMFYENDDKVLYQTHQHPHHHHHHDEPKPTIIEDEGDIQGATDNQMDITQNQEQHSMHILEDTPIIVKEQLIIQSDEHRITESNTLTGASLLRSQNNHINLIAPSVTDIHQTTADIKPSFGTLQEDDKVSQNFGADLEKASLITNDTRTVPNAVPPPEVFDMLPREISETRIRPEGSEYKAHLLDIPQFGQPADSTIRREIKEDDHNQEHLLITSGGDQVVEQRMPIMTTDNTIQQTDNLAPEEKLLNTLIKEEQFEKATAAQFEQRPADLVIKAPVLTKPVAEKPPLVEDHIHVGHSAFQTKLELAKAKAHLLGIDKTDDACMPKSVKDKIMNPHRVGDDPDIIQNDAKHDYSPRYSKEESKTFTTTQMLSKSDQKQLRSEERQTMQQEKRHFKFWGKKRSNKIMNTPPPKKNDLGIDKADIPQNLLTVPRSGNYNIGVYNKLSKEPGLR